MPTVYSPHVDKKYRLGIVPHYIEKKESYEYFQMPSDCVYIDIMSDPETFVRDILSCQYILSSSLHGLILAEAYKIPSMYYMLTNKIIGGSFKYNDYYSMDGRNTQRVVLSERCNIDDIIHQIQKSERPQQDVSGLIESCPFRRKLNV
jgi:pyruvyltransferase